MHSLRNPLAGAAALAIALALTAAVGPAAGASSLLRAREQQKAHVAIVAPKISGRLSTGGPTTGRRQNAGCPSGTTMTNGDAAGYGACAPSVQSFTKVSDFSVIPNIPVCNECVARATFGIELANNKKFASTGPRIVEPVAADGVLIQQASTGNSYFTFWALGTSTGTLMIHPMTTVNEGDKISATVEQSGNKAVFTVIDHTHPMKDSFHRTQTCGGCTFTTAEWGVSAIPLDTGTGYYQLPEFGTWKISQAVAATSSGSGTISGFGWTNLTLVNQAMIPKVLATAGPLNATGSGFADTWIAAS
jgi:hypothetical protein